MTDGIKSIVHVASKFHLSKVVDNVIVSFYTRRKEAIYSTTECEQYITLIERKYSYILAWMLKISNLDNTFLSCFLFYNLRSSKIPLCKFTTLQDQYDTQEHVRIIGRSQRARNSCNLLFSLANQYGDHFQEGWRAVCTTDFYI